MSVTLPTPLNSLEFSKNHGDNATYTDEEYATLAEAAAKEVHDLCANLERWNLLYEKDGIRIYERPSSLKGTNETMLLSTATVPCSMEKIEKLVSPTLGYREKWDEILDGIEQLRDFGNEVVLVRHLVKKLYIINPRESIDIVKTVRGPNEITFGSTSVTHDDYPPIKAYVRTHQHIGGYYLRPAAENPEHTEFHMVFHADLNMSRLVRPILLKFKPKLMCQKIENLRRAAVEFKDI